MTEKELREDIQILALKIYSEDSALKEIETLVKDKGFYYRD